MRYSCLLKLFSSILLGIFLLIVTEVYIFEDLYKGNPGRKVYLFVAITLITTFLFLSSIFFFYKLTTLLQRETTANANDRLRLEESQKLIQLLRSERHDYKNQLQVIRVLALMNKNEEIEKYILDCKEALDLSSSILVQVQNPIISAMLLAFMTEAKEKGIMFEIDCDVDFSNFDLPPVKITRILGNIIQNAIEAFEGGDFSEPTIQMTIWDTSSSYHFIIWNNGPVIPAGIQEQIYFIGYSTKQSSGLGLSIVKALTDEMNGRVFLKSNPDFGTEFQIVIPKSIKKEIENC